LRFYPQGAQMTTYTYTPLVGMSSECDVDNRISYYYYDALGRLRYAKDQDGNILKTIEYHYYGQ
jgi:YD repeat-containing protein